MPICDRANALRAPNELVIRCAASDLGGGYDGTVTMVYRKRPGRLLSNGARPATGMPRSTVQGHWRPLLGASPRLSQRHVEDFHPRLLNLGLKRVAVLASEQADVLAGDLVSNATRPSSETYLKVGSCQKKSSGSRGNCSR